MPLINWAAIDWVSLVAVIPSSPDRGTHRRETVVWQSHARGRGDCNFVRYRLRGLVLRS